jgi:hypothetical protein
MGATQVLEIKIVSCGGMVDLMSEQEGSFLMNSLGLFRNVADMGRSTPRANASLIRAYSRKDLLRSLSGEEHILHLIAHGNASSLQVGGNGTAVTASQIENLAKQNAVCVPEIVISTACSLQSEEWRSALQAAGARVLVAAQSAVTPANLTAFDMAFYSALLAQVRKGSTNIERVKASFELADSHYRSIHAAGTPFAKFKLTEF